MTNRIWRFIRKRKPPQPRQNLKTITRHTAPITLEMAMQSIVAKRFVICEEWQQEHAPSAPENPHPWAIIGTYRVSAYSDDIMLMMAPYKDDGFADFGNVLHVPVKKVGVAANQE